VETRWIGLMILSFMEFQLFVLASYSVLGPVIAQKDYAGATTWALIAAVSGVGAVLGDVISLRIRPTRPLVISNLAAAAPLVLLIALGLHAPLWVLIGGAVLFGLGFSVSNTLWFTALQDHVPDHLIGRVSSFDWLGSTALRPIGLAIVAPIAAVVGPAVVLIVASGIAVLTLLGVTAVPSVRGLRSGGALSGSDDEPALEP
jgi:MFS family permease